MSAAHCISAANRASTASTPLYSLASHLFESRHKSGGTATYLVLYVLADVDCANRELVHHDTLCAAPGI